ncbi:cation diffusion facilitator family transporter [Alphaproteobacteria bacterium]|nr:cation diffusion facilitator family transporter [Alphaproteobacteria bacterium]
MNSKNEILERGANDLAHKSRQIQLASSLAVIVALSLIGLKTYAWLATGSIALLGSLFDSVLDFSISFINFFVVRHALTPADDEHRFGHGKAEALAALAQALVISVSAILLIMQSVDRFFNPQPISHGVIGIVVIVIAIVATLGLVFFQRKVAKSTGSLAISADSAHYEADLYMNLAVILSLVLTIYADFALADPILGGVVALMLLMSAREILAKSSKQLMDHEANDETRGNIEAIIGAHPEVRSFHDLRTRHSGTQLFIQAHIELDGEMSLFRAHEIAEEVEAALLMQYPGADVILHQDPEGYDA